MSHTSIDFQHRPKLNRGARLRFDEQSNRYVLLSPERALLLNSSAGEVVRRCDGSRTVAQIANELSQGESEVGDSGRADESDRSGDILQLLIDLRRKQLVHFDGLL